MTGKVPGIKVKIIDAEALVVGPEDRLLLRVKGEINDEEMAAFSQALGSIGLRERSLIISGDVEMGKVEPEA